MGGRGGEGGFDGGDGLEGGGGLDGGGGGLGGGRSFVAALMWTCATLPSYSTMLDSIRAVSASSTGSGASYTLARNWRVGGGQGSVPSQTSSLVLSLSRGVLLSSSTRK